MARRSTHPRRSRLPKRPGSKRTLALIGLGVFALTDLVLIGLALGMIGGGADEGDTEARPAASFTAEASPEPTETPEPMPPATPVLRSLTVVDEQVAWRAERGGCDTQAVVEVTSDGGATWTATRPVTTEGHEVLWLWAQDESYAQAAVSAGDDCQLTGIRTFTSGNFWQLSPDALDEAAFIAPDGSLVTPSGATAPCDTPVDVAVRGGALAVICADGTLHESLDGAGWTRASVPGALAITEAGEGYALAVQRLEGCNGIALVSMSAESLASGGPPSEARSCLTGSVDAQATVLASSPDAVWMWSGAEHSAAPLDTVLP